MRKQSSSGKRLLTMSLLVLGAAGYWFISRAPSDAARPSEAAAVMPLSPELGRFSDGVTRAPVGGDNPTHATPEPAAPEPAATAEPPPERADGPSDELVDGDDASQARGTDSAEASTVSGADTFGASPVILQFPGRVLSAVGRKLSKGAPCVVAVSLVDARIDSLDVTCGNLLLYDTRTPLNGMSRFGGQVFERARGSAKTATGEEWIYRLQFSDTGPRSSRSQVNLNSMKRKGSVFSESADPFRVELSLGEFSLRRWGEPLFETPTAAAPLSRTLELTSAKGATPKLPHAPCSLTAKFVEATRTGPSCKTQLRCGNSLLYGRGDSGYGPCKIAEAQILSFDDPMQTHEDGDPALYVDLNAQQVRLSDSPAQRAFSLEFGLLR